jgi:hypothetical protein
MRGPRVLVRSELTKGGRVLIITPSRTAYQSGLFCHMSRAASATDMEKHVR